MSIIINEWFKKNIINGRWIYKKNWFRCITINWVTRLNSIAQVVIRLNRRVNVYSEPQRARVDLQIPLLSVSTDFSQSINNSIENFKRVSALDGCNGGVISHWVLAKTRGFALGFYIHLDHCWVFWIDEKCPRILHQLPAKLPRINALIPPHVHTVCHTCRKYSLPARTPQ